MNKILTTYLISALLGFAGTLAGAQMAKADAPKFWYRHMHGVGKNIEQTEPETEPEDKEDQKIQIAFTKIEADVSEKNGFHNAGVKSILGLLTLRADISDAKIDRVGLSGKTCFGNSCVPVQFILKCNNNVCSYSDQETAYTVSLFHNLSEKTSAAYFLNQLLKIEIDTVYRATDNTSAQVEVSTFELKNGRFSQPFFNDWLYTVPNFYFENGTKKVIVSSNSELVRLYMKKNKNDQVEIFSDYEMTDEYVFDSLDDEMLHKNIARRFFNE